MSGGTPGYLMGDELFRDLAHIKKRLTEPSGSRRKPEKDRGDPGTDEDGDTEGGRSKTEETGEDG